VQNPTHHTNELSSGFQSIVSAHGNESMANPEDNIHDDKIFDSARTEDSAPSPPTLWAPPINASETASSTYLNKALPKIYRWLETRFILSLLINSCMCLLFLLAWAVHGAGKFIYEVFQERRGRDNIARRNN
jgi:hypothetical protein